MKYSYLSVFLVWWLFSASIVRAGEPDFLHFVRYMLLPCAHPTTDIEQAQVTYAQEPQTIEIGRIKTRVSIRYKGWLKDNAMLVEVILRQCCDDSLLIKAEVLRDSSGTGTMACKYLSGGWFDLDAEFLKDTDKDKLDSGKYTKSSGVR